MGKDRKRIAFIAGGVFLVLLAAGLLFPMTYYLNDDVTMRSILSGSYTGVPDGHAVYMKYPLTGLIVLLYRIKREIPWFDLVLAGCYFVAVTLVLCGTYRLLDQNTKKSTEKNPAKIWIPAGMVCLCAALFLPHFIYLHYTIVAAVLCACGLFLYLTGMWRSAFVLLFTGLCVRSQVFFLALPFLAVAGLWSFPEKKGKAVFKEGLILAVGILFILGLQKGMYASSDWKYYFAYNDSRTQLYDYEELLPFEEYRKAYEEAGIGEEEYRILEEYDTALDAGVGQETFENAARISAQEKAAYRFSPEYFKKCLKDYYYHLRYTDRPYNILWMILLIGVCITVIGTGDWKRIILTGCYVGGRSLIWLYLIFKGRFPERVYVSLYLMESMLLAGMLCMFLRETSLHGQLPGRWLRKKESAEHRLGQDVCRSRKFYHAAGCLSCLLLCVFLCLQMKETWNRLQQQNAEQEEWDALITYCAEHEDSFFLLDVRSVAAYSGRAFQKENGISYEKQTALPQNYLLAGGWMGKTPLMKKRFALLGAEDGGDLLIKAAAADVDSRDANGKNSNDKNAGDDNVDGGVYFVVKAGKDPDWLAQYLTKRCGREEEKAFRALKADSVRLFGEELFDIYVFR